jgi:CRP-like cAMP-binding protein
VKLRYVGNAPFFSALSEEEQERVSQRMHLEHRHSGETLFSKGEGSSALYLIKSGWVRLLANGGAGLASQGPGSLVGETDLFLDRPRSLGATAVTDAELWALGKEDLTELITQDPKIGLKLSVAFGSRLALFDQYLVEQRLEQLPLLSDVEEGSLVAIARRLVPMDKQQGEFIIEGGQPPEALFIVESGQVHLHSSEEGGDFSELGEGESFGELAVLTGKPHSRSAQAATDAILWALLAPEFDALAEEHPDIRLSLSKAVREPLLAQDQGRAVERLAAMPLFADLTEDVLWAVSERLLLRHVPAGEMVFAEGAPGDALYLIDSGRVEILSDKRSGSVVLARMGADEFFGEMALLTGKPRSASARTASHTNLWVLYRSDFDDLVNRYPSISLALSKVLSERLAQMDRRFTESHLRGLKLLAGLSPTQLEDVSSRLKPVRYRQGEVIIREGDAGQEMYFIESGRVRVVRGTGPQALLLAELGAGDLFGEMALLTGSPRSATVTAISELNLWAMSQADFDAMVTAYPNLALALSRLLSDRLRSTDARFLTAPSAAAAAVSQPAVTPKPRPPQAPKPAAKPKPKAAPRKRSRGLMAEVGDAFNGTVSWFGALSRGAKLRLLLITLVIAWLVFIAAPVLVISTLAADNVTNLQGAIAFVQTATPVPTEAPLATATPEPQAAMVSAPSEANGAAAGEEAVQSAEAVPVEAPVVAPDQAPTEAPVEEAAAPADMAAAEAPAAPQATPTPWIIVITNTPLPPTATPLPTNTPVPPTATPRPTPKRVTSAAAPVGPSPTPAGKPQPPRDLDPRLGSLNVNVQPAGVRPGQSYWRLIAVRWENESQSGGGHSIFVDLLDEGGAKIVGHPVEIRWAGGGLSVTTEQKPSNEPSSNFPMYNTLGSYSVSIPGLPSDVLVGLGLGTADQPAFTIHTNFFLTFKRVTR